MARRELIQAVSARTCRFPPGGGRTAHPSPATLTEPATISAVSDPTDALAATAISVGRPLAASSSTISQVGRYRVERELGAGGMGIVYAAHDPELDRRVALKVLRVVGDDARARLSREARAMAKLTHPNVVRVYEVGTVDDRAYIAMELVDGSSLAEWLSSGEHTMADRVSALLAAGHGLAAAHAAGVVHRDFKPHNVLRAHDGRILVTDFGLARSSTSSVEESARVASADASPLAVLTRTGSFVGTPAYMAPEQWNGSVVTAATDQFAFCVSLWEAITHKRPFTGTTLDALRAQVERGPATLDARGISAAMKPILRRGLDPDPAKRWPNMTVLLGAIAATRRSSRGVIIAALVAAVVVALAVGTFVVTRDSHEAQPLPTQFTKLSDGRVTAPQPAVAALVEALRGKVGARFIPAFGTKPGFKLYAIRVGSYIDAIGLLNGDTLTAVDGHPVDTIAHLDQVLQGLTNARAFRLDILRAGAERTLVIESTSARQ